MSRPLDAYLALAQAKDAGLTPADMAPVLAALDWVGADLDLEPGGRVAGRAVPLIVGGRLGERGASVVSG